jgi:hypothetical protein
MPAEFTNKMAGLGFGERIWQDWALAREYEDVDIDKYPILPC